AQLPERGQRAGAARFVGRGDDHARLGDRQPVALRRAVIGLEARARERAHRTGPHLERGRERDQGRTAQAAAGSPWLRPRTPWVATRPATPAPIRTGIFFRPPGDFFVATAVPFAAPLTALAAVFTFR